MSNLLHKITRGPDHDQSYIVHFPDLSLREPAAVPPTARGVRENRSGYVQDVTIFLRWWQGTFGEELTLEALRADPFCLNRKALQDFLSWLQTTQDIQPAQCCATRRPCEPSASTSPASKLSSTIRLWGCGCRPGRSRNQRGWMMLSVPASRPPSNLLGWTR